MWGGIENGFGFHDKKVGYSGMTLSGIHCIYICKYRSWTGSLVGQLLYIHVYTCISVMGQIQPLYVRVNGKHTLDLDWGAFANGARAPQSSRVMKALRCKPSAQYLAAPCASRSTR